MSWHMGRSWWPAHPLEDACPCPKAPCGLVIAAKVNPNCPEHAWAAGRSMREIHTDESCEKRMESPR